MDDKPQSPLGGFLNQGENKNQYIGALRLCSILHLC